MAAAAWIFVGRIYAGLNHTFGAYLQNTLFLLTSFAEWHSTRAHRAVAVGIAVSLFWSYYYIESAATERTRASILTIFLYICSISRLLFRSVQFLPLFAYTDAQEPNDAANG